ncbi:MFS transporter [Lutimaribacter marinistellae]|uniref:MFS transporter n=1 Tax=Lutimaribacter marinistellae TaxID=1820329 RepID=A0ABV7TE21_9RHOB
MRTFLKQNARWLAAGGLLTFLSSFGQTFFISVFAGEIRETFNLSHGAWGGIYTLGTTASAVVMVWAGSLTDQFRVRQLGPLILVGLAAACLSMAFNQWAWGLVPVVFLLRFFGQGMSSHIAMVAMARWFTKTRGRALSIATVGFAVGEAVLPLLFVSAMTVFDWRMLWVVAAAIALLGIPVLWKLLAEERTPQSFAQSYVTFGMEGRHWTRKQALAHPLFWMMVPAILGPAAFVTAFFFHQVHLAELKGWAHVELVALFPLYTAIGMASMFASGWALDKFGTAGLMPFYQLPMAAGFLFFGLGDSTAMAVLGIALIGVTTGANSTLPAAFWAEFYGTAHIGAIKSLATAVMVLGSAIGPGLTGFLIDLGWGLEGQFNAIALYFCLTAALTWLGVSRAKQLL